MVLELFDYPASPFCRSVKMAAKLLNIYDKIDLHEINLFTSDHMKPEYLEKNPFHKVPLLNDDGFYLSESRAILRYLVTKYGSSDSSLYPKDIQQRAVVDQMLDVDAGTFSPAVVAVVRPLLREGKKPTEEGLKGIDDVVQILNLVLGKTAYIAGDKLTIADLAMIATISLVQGLKVDISAHTNVTAWATKIQSEVPNYVEINDEPIEKLKEFIKSKMQAAAAAAAQ